jgi:Ca2+-binding EF-hand superfamily protein
MNMYRFLILVALTFALGCGGGPSANTTPKSSSNSEFGKMCRAMGAEGGKLKREKFIAQAEDKEAAAKLFDACDTQQKGYLTEEDVTPAYMDRLKGQALHLPRGSSR